MRIAIVILAGGEGRRIGGGKPLRMLGGKTLLERAYDRARDWSRNLAVAVRDVSQIGDTAVPVILDDPHLEGPLAGLASALRFAREVSAGAALTLPADMPFLPADLASRLQNELGGCGAAIAESGDRLHPVCGLWQTDMLGELPRYLESGRRSLTGFASLVGFAAVHWPSDPVDPFFNINSPEDLVAAERLMRP